MTIRPHESAPGLTASTGNERHDFARAGQNRLSDGQQRALRRRGLFAAAWAAAVGLVLKYTTKPVEAAASLQYADTTATQTNTAAGPTVLVASDATYTSTASVFTGQTVVSGARAGLQGVAGLRGPALITCGVFGESGRGTGTAGVVGYGNGSSMGIMAQSDSGLPILGQVTSESGANTIAIYGLNYSTYAGPSAGAGGFAIYGLSAKGHGLVGATAAAGAAAVVGATNGVAGAYAAAFYGPVIVGGNFTVVGGAKSAAVPHPDGSHRRLYCMESPESWFEDFGKAQLDCGRAEVTLDPDFAAVVDLSDYHVFLTEYGDHHGLHITRQTSTGFVVQAKDGDGTGTFSWRVVAKRKDIGGTRLERVKIPPEPAMPAVPEVTRAVRPSGVAEQ